jgi:hypothetical protein
VAGLGVVVHHGLSGRRLMMDMRRAWRYMRCDGGDGRLDKVNALIPILKMSNMSTATSQVCATVHVDDLLDLFMFPTRS